MTLTVVLINAAGWLGMALLISAYFLVTAGKIVSSGVPFQLMNLVGGFCLMLNTAYYGAWPPTVLNLVWVVIGVFGLVRMRRVVRTVAHQP